MTLDTSHTTGLDPVREALLEAARRDAREARSRADEAVGRTLATAATEAERIRLRAREQGAADAAAELRSRRTQARREGHAVVLGARLEAYEALRSAARTAAARLRDNPGYPALRHSLVEAARQVLGGDAAVRDGEGGGVVAEAGGCRLDYSFLGLADRAADAVAGEEEP